MQVAIFTANGESLHPMLDEIAEASGVKVSDNRYIIVGCEKVPGFEAVAIGAKVDTVKVQPGIVELAKQTIATHPRASPIGLHFLIGFTLNPAQTLPLLSCRCHALRSCMAVDAAPWVVSVHEIDRNMSSCREIAWMYAC